MSVTQEIKTKIQEESAILLKFCELFYDKKTLRDNLACRIRDANQKEIQKFIEELFKNHKTSNTKHGRQTIAQFIVYFLNVNCRISEKGKVLYSDIDTEEDIATLTPDKVRPLKIRNWIYTVYEKQKPLVDVIHRAMNNKQAGNSKTTLQIIEEFYDWLPLDADSIIKLFCGPTSHFPRTSEVVNTICPSRIADPLASDSLLKSLLIRTKQFFRGFYVGSVRFIWRTIEGIFNWKTTLKGIGTLIYKICTLDGKYFYDAFDQLYAYARDEPVAFWTEVLWNAALIVITISASSGAFTGTAVAQKSKQTADAAKLASNVPVGPTTPLTSTPPPPNGLMMKAAAIPTMPPTPPAVPVVTASSQLTAFEVIAGNSATVHLSKHSNRVNFHAVTLNASIPVQSVPIPPPTVANVPSIPSVSITPVTSLQPILVPTVAISQVEEVADLSPIPVEANSTEEEFEGKLVEFISRYRAALGALNSEEMVFHDMLLKETLFRAYSQPLLE